MFTPSSKRPALAHVFWIVNTFAGSLLDVCWIV